MWSRDMSSTQSNHYPSGIEVSSDPQIYVFENFLTAEECEHIISCARSNMSRAEVTFDKANTKSHQRTNNVNWIPHQQTPITNNVSIKACQIVGMPLVNAEFIQVIHYAETQEYQPHFDAWDAATDVGKRCMETGGQRLITCLIYLNDVEEGGGTIFPNLDVEVRAIKGRMVLFHNCTPGTNIIHPDTLHGGMPVVKGEKWACNIWFREKRYQNVVAGAVKAGSARRVI
jgi:prolyl 4-hydroxylase